MSSPTVPTAEQLAAARSSQWHQNGEALLTFENLRSWINVAGLVLFTPRPGQLPAPAPSLVEGVLGLANPQPGLAEMEQAKSLLARLVAEGIAVPLNLLGTPGDTPDFIATAPVFSYIFTLRGDKAWKQPPATSGALKVSPLAAATHELLAKSGAHSAYDLTTQLGKEVTESAVLRALNELWAHLRVIPVGQTDGGATLWELTSARFTKHIKAGANAGQPSALSALISLYLGSAMLATEEEIETFLSPLAARSRIRDVVHALLGARELETLVVDGRTLLHVSGSLPAFAAPDPTDADVHAKPVPMIAVEAAGELRETDAPRIKKFVTKPRKLGTGFPSDYGRKFSGAPLDERTRRPFGKGPRPDRGADPGRGRPAFVKQAFNKPWDEERAARQAAPSRSNVPVETGGLRPEPRAANSYERKARAEGGEARSISGRKPSFGSKPGFGRKPEFGRRPPFGSKPAPAGRPGPEDRNGSGGRAGAREESGQRPSFRSARDVAPRRDGDADTRPPRKTFSKPGTFTRKREASSGYVRSAGSRAPRNEVDRRDFGEGSGRPARSSERPNRSASEKPSSGFAPRTPGSFSPRPQHGSGGKPGFARDRETPGGAGQSRPVYRKFDAPRGDRPARPYKPERSQGRSDRPSRPFSNTDPGGDRKPYSKAAGTGFGAKRPANGTGRPTGTFAKFADGKNPFRKPGKPGGKAGSFKGKATSFSKPAYRERKPKAGE